MLDIYFEIMALELEMIVYCLTYGIYDPEVVNLSFKYGII